MRLKEFAPEILLLPLESALVSLHLFLIFSGGGGSYILVRSPALYLWGISVKRALVI